jgi:hypothetical protein
VQEYELSSAALRALNDMREDYVFEDGPAFLNEALDVLHQLTDLTHEERQLRAELEAMPPLVRAALSRAMRTAGEESR